MRPLVPALTAVALLVGACGSPGSEPGTTPPPAGASVEIKLFAYDPPELSVSAGRQVTWTNQDEILHTVTAGPPDAPEPERFDGQLDGIGATFTTTFDEPGTYAYFCSRHPTAMTGTVEVE